MILNSITHHYNLIAAPKIAPNSHVRRCCAWRAAGTAQPTVSVSAVFHNTPAGFSLAIFFSKALLFIHERFYCDVSVETQLDLKTFIFCHCDTELVHKLA